VPVIDRLLIVTSPAGSYGPALVTSAPSWMPRIWIAFCAKAPGEPMVTLLMVRSWLYPNRRMSPRPFPPVAVALSLNWLLRIDTAPIVSPSVGVEPLPVRT
jgi:hypothetical protein